MGAAGSWGAPGSSAFLPGAVPPSLHGHSSGCFIPIIAESCDFMASITMFATILFFFPP